MSRKGSRQQSHLQSHPSMEDDGMIVDKHEDEEQPQPTLRPGLYFGKGKKMSQDIVKWFLLRFFFKDTNDKKLINKRKDEFLKDLSLNLITGKVAKCTTYFDCLDELGMRKLFHACEREPQARSDEECRLIEPLLRQMGVFSHLVDFEEQDYHALAQEVKLHKMRKHTRIVNYSENSDTLYLVMRGRVGIIYPESDLKRLFDGDPDELRARVELMTNMEADRQNRLNQGVKGQGDWAAGSGKSEAEKQKLRNQRLAEAKSKNSAFRMFDQMLGMAQDPKLAEIKERARLTKINIPKCDLVDLDERLREFYEAGEGEQSMDERSLNLQQQKSMSPMRIDTKLKDQAFSDSDSPMRGARSPRKLNLTETAKQSDIGEENQSEDDGEIIQERELQFHELECNSSVKRPLNTFDVPLYRDKQKKFVPMETLFGSIIPGCAMGQMCFSYSKDPRKWAYSAITIADSFIISLNREDILKVIDNQKKRVLNDQMTFLRAIPSPEFNLLSRTMLIKICDQLQPFHCIKGCVIFNQDDPMRYVYFIKNGEFSSQIRLRQQAKVQGLDPNDMLKVMEHSTGKLASKSKTMSAKANQKSFRQYQIAILGMGSVVSCEEVLVAKSETHITTLTCLSMHGELYRIDKDFFFSKLAGQSIFMKRLEKACYENIKAQVKKVGLLKQHESQETTSLATQERPISPPAQNGPSSPPQVQQPQQDQPRKIDLVNFDSSNIQHIAPVIEVVRPDPLMPPQVQSPASQQQSPARNTAETARESPTKEPLVDVSDPKKPIKQEMKVQKQQEAFQRRYNRAWKLLERDHSPTSGFEDTQIATPSKLPVIAQTRPVTHGVGKRGFSMRNNMNLANSVKRVEPILRTQNSTYRESNNMTSQTVFSSKIRQNIFENRRKVNEALSLMKDEQPKRNPIKGDPLSINVAASQNLTVHRAISLKPRVVALQNPNQKLGELSCAKMSFHLVANPRVSCNQAALFISREQQMNSPMFSKPFNTSFQSTSVNKGSLFMGDRSQSFVSPIKSRQTNKRLSTNYG